MKLTRIYWLILVFVILTGLSLSIVNIVSNTTLIKDLTEGSRINEIGTKNTTKVKGSPITNITGTVKSVDKNDLIIAFTPTNGSGADPKTETKIAHFTPNTKFVAMVSKSAAEIKADLKKFQADFKKGIIVAPPSPMREINIDPTDIKLTMVVTAFADNDISQSDSFDATKISFQTF